MLLMKKTLLTLCVTMLVAVSLLATACLPASASINVTQEDMEQAAEDDNGQLPEISVTIASDGELTVTLYSQLGAGMRWAAEIKDTGILKTADYDYISDAPENTVGGPGREVWTFKALSEGVTTLILTYSSVADGGTQNINTLEIVVKVK